MTAAELSKSGKQARVNRVILDTDLAMGAPGSDIDDGFALALAVGDPRLSVELITTVNGNTDVESATLLTQELLRRLGRETIRVVRGASAPLLRPDLARAGPETIRAEYGEYPDGPPYAAVEIARRIIDNPGEITVIAIGPLTNIATAIALDARVAQRVREIVVMGGVFLGHTHETGMPGEFNVWSDPEAAEAVLRSGAPVKWVGLDVTRQVRLTHQDAREMASGGGAFGAFAGKYTNEWIDYQAGRHPGESSHADSCAMHDPLAVAVVSHPEFVVWRPAHVSIVTGDGVARGMTVTDLLGSHLAPEPNCQIAVEVDVDRFRSHLLSTISGL